MTHPAAPARVHGLMRFASTLMRVLYRPRIENAAAIPVDGPAIVAGNHGHAFDPVLVAAATSRRMYTLAKRELHDGRFGWIFRAVGSIPVDLDGPGNHNATVAAIVRLREGALVNVSPEAGRNRTAELLLPFKPGAIKMAKAAGAPIIPYGIAGEYRPFRRSLRIRFGAPLRVDDLEYDQATALLRDRVAELLTELGHVPVGRA